MNSIDWALFTAFNFCKYVFSLFRLQQVISASNFYAPAISQLGWFKIIDDAVRLFVALGEIGLNKTGMTTITRSLEETYKATRYEVTLEGGIAVIKVGKTCSALDDLCNEFSVISWAFITAFNPFSQPLPDEENLHRQQLLGSLLRAGKFNYFMGRGIGDSGDWPPEPSFLILGIEQEKALAYGRVFDQNAIVCGDCGSVAQLLLCAPR